MVNPSRALSVAAIVAASSVAASTASAQTLGTFRWQQQPYCNVITLNVVQSGAVFQLDGVDDQCGAATSAAVVGMAFVNANGTVGLGMTLVTTPGGTPLHLDAAIALTGNGTWRDSSGATGAFVLTPGAGSGGATRPVPRTSFPAGLSAAGTTITNLATPVAGTDAATKAYVDGAAATKANTADVRAALLADKVWPALVQGGGVKGSTGRYTTSTSGTGVYNVTFTVLPLGIVPPSLQQAVWTVTPLCAGFTAAITIRSVGSANGGILNTFGMQVQIRNSAAVLADCGVAVVAVFPDADAPDSPVPPFLVGGHSAGSCTTVGDVTTCVEGTPK